MRGDSESSEFSQNEEEEEESENATAYLESCVGLKAGVIKSSNSGEYEVVGSEKGLVAASHEYHEILDLSRLTHNLLSSEILESSVFAA